ncbi:MAG: magnesium transporter [candidate division NC10 bacterium]|nr:magnesium transporter [candidate division NC10 bacterium]MBI2163102.1 magnesium transporter [candidate division NC10 bacterium]
MPALSFSQLRHRPLVDAEGAAVGRLEDLVVLALGARPQVTKFSLRRPDREEWILPWDVVADLPPDPGAPIRLRSRASDLSPVTLRTEEMRLGKNVLDKKVVDTARKKVVRVNDIELEEREGRLHVIGVEGGLRGLLRHLKSERLAERLAALVGAELPREVVPWEVLDTLETELTRAKRQAVYTKLAKLHPADIADIMEELNPAERAEILAALDEATAAEAITEAEPEVQASMVQMMEPEKAADILEEMEPDEAADILSDLPEAKAEELLESMAPEEAQEVEELLEHEEDTAGGLMTTEHVAFAPSLTVADAIQRIRDEAKEAETIYYLYVTDPQERLLGVLSLRELILADPGRRLEQIMHPEVISVRPETGLREVAELQTKYNLLALPVVSGEGEMLGIITVDDVLNLILPMIWKKRAVKRFL